jgi:hypothetical protein
VGEIWANPVKGPVKRSPTQYYILTTFTKLEFFKASQRISVPEIHVHLEVLLVHAISRSHSCHGNHESKNPREAGVTYPGQRPSANRWLPAASLHWSTSCEQIMCLFEAMRLRRILSMGCRL